MNCHTRVVVDGKPGFCGHSITAHESGMGGLEPCMIEGCPCENFTRDFGEDQ